MTFKTRTRAHFPVLGRGKESVRGVGPCEVLVIFGFATKRIRICQFNNTESPEDGDEFSCRNVVETCMQCSLHNLLCVAYLWM